MEQALEVPDVSGVVSRSVTILETLEAVDDGHARRRARELEVGEGTSTFELAGEDASATSIVGELESPLVGRPLVLEETDGSWRARFESENEGPQELLEGLDPDLDLAGLLPEESVGPGDSWEVPAERLRCLLAPGGELGFELLGLPEGYVAVLPPGDAVVGLIWSLRGTSHAPEGDATCRWVETVEEDGARLARIDVEFDLELAADLSEQVARSIEEIGLEPRRRQAQYRSAIHVEGTGRLAWDLSAGRFRTFEATLDTGATPDTSFEATSLVVASRHELKGSTRLRAESVPE